MQIVEYDTEYRVHIDFNRLRRRNNAAVKKIPYAKYDRNEKCWRIPLNQRINMIKLQHYTNAKYFKINDTDPEEFENIPELPNLKNEIPLSHPEGFGFRPYQEQGVARGLQLKKLMNGDEQGLGKTLQSIGTIYGAHLNGEKVFPCLVICPASTKINWKREWEMWTDRKAMVLESKSKDTWQRFYELGMADVFIVNYESLKKYFVKYMPPKGQMRKSSDILMDDRVNLLKSVIVDESHRCKDTKTQQAKFVLNICKDKERVILLTGTPVVNKPIDLFPQLAIMNRLHHFGGKKGYLERYCEGGRGAANLKELNFLLNKFCFFRREKKDVAKDLPEKQRQTILCDITTRQRYNRARDEFVEYLKEQGADDAEIAKKLRGEIMVKMAELKKLSAYGKLNEAKEFIKEVTESGEKLIVFVIHHVIVDELLKEFPNAVTVTGRDDVDDKQRSIDSFQKDPNTKLIICNIKAAGVGITLTASSRVAFIEYPWTYADCVQCEDRAHRIGQTNNVMCTYFLGHNTIDQQLYEMIQEKRHTGNTITGASDEMKMEMVSNVMDLFKK
ncbi:DEAD/DEAH box helicase [Mesonia aestuariivivens]|uniref:DEAD/DEAH box helicase n=1 Tax=Mesonia aestuariivivens TaxID=2796128 RepID=A0ABS6W0D0_9FLAO|nr:DEAD/DEAH box helicase [Mesonia aestuariivivens]MBW2961290.1 DEAD/DEAH box helicase [Mesonia aestuariivivens]